MVTISINNEEVMLDVVWYHYKTPFQATCTYSLLIGLEEYEVLKVVENYAKCSIDSDQIESVVISKDKSYKSRGLIWNLFLSFKKQKRLTNEAPIVWMLNNIRRMEKKNGFLLISGDASDNKFGEDSIVKLSDIR